MSTRRRRQVDYSGQDLDDIVYPNTSRAKRDIDPRDIKKIIDDENSCKTGLKWVAGTCVVCFMIMIVVIFIVLASAIGMNANTIVKEIDGHTDEFHRGLDTDNTPVVDSNGLSAGSTAVTTDTRQTRHYANGTFGEVIFQPTLNITFNNNPTIAPIINVTARGHTAPIDITAGGHVSNISNDASGSGGTTTVGNITGGDGGKSHLANVTATGGSGASESKAEFANVSLVGGGGYIEDINMTSEGAEVAPIQVDTNVDTGGVFVNTSTSTETNTST